MWPPTCPGARASDLSCDPFKRSLSKQWSLFFLLKTISTSSMVASWQILWFPLQGNFKYYLISIKLMRMTSMGCKLFPPNASDRPFLSGGKCTGGASLLQGVLLILPSRFDHISKLKVRGLSGALQYFILFFFSMYLLFFFLFSFHVFWVIFSFFILVSTTSCMVPCM